MRLEAGGEPEAGSPWMANLAGFLTLGAALGRAQLPGGESADYVAGSDCPTRFVVGLSVLAWQAQAAWGVAWEG